MASAGRRPMPPTKGGELTLKCDLLFAPPCYSYSGAVGFGFASGIIFIL